MSSVNDIYRFLRFYNDIRAFSNGRIGERIVWRLWGKASWSIGNALVRGLRK